MKKQNKLIKKILGIAGVCLLFLALMTILNHSIGNAWVTTDYRPSLTDSPVYVEFSETTPLCVSITPSESFTMNGLDVVLVNISGESRGTLLTTLSAKDGTVISSSRNPLSEITVGSWYEISMNSSLTQGEEYQITFSVDSGNPYFMSLDPNSGNSLPYSLNVDGHGDAYISLGITRVDIVPQTFGDIFYYSIPLTVIAFIFFILWAMLGNSFIQKIRTVPFRKLLKKYGNELFLVIVYISICISVFVHSYIQSVYITSDSTGYMREAVNLISGNGFSYDGLAGYKTWFANWPILYPVLLAGVMLITRTNAYLASKILALIIVLIIMLVIYAYAKKDAWLYSLALLNTGFITLTWYTWSEIPFMLFIMCFGLFLGKLLKENHPKKALFIFTGLFALLSFLTRYYGLFVYFVMGIYILYFGICFLKEKSNKAALYKAIGLICSAGISGILCLGYLFMNKLQNGMASGVARTMWWDDYGILTNDLITSLLTEFFHIFSLETPDFISTMPVKMQVWVLFIILIFIAIIIKEPIKKLNEHSVWIVMSILYYIMFIGIRYVSSMDTFYFRFFEPATFTLSLGIIGYLLEKRKKTDKETLIVSNAGIVITALVIISSISLICDGELTETPYYTELTSTWDDAYAEIPEKSVVIFSDLDFRASYYRPDVIEGSIDPSMTLDVIRSTYYGSDNMCIKLTDAEAMVAEPVYPEDVDSAIKTALGSASGESKYIIIPLK